MNNSVVEITILNHHSRLSPRLWLEVQALADAGCRVRVVLWNRNQSPIQVPKDTQQIRWDQIRVSAPQGTLFLLLYLPFVYLAFARKIGPASTHVFHCTHLILLPLTIWLAKHYGCKVVYDAYEFYAIDLANYFGALSGYARRLIEHVENLLTRQVDLVLTISTLDEILAHRYEQQGIPVQVLLNVPDPDYEELGKKLGNRLVPPHCSVIAYVGGIQRNKGLLIALRALDLVIKEFPEAKLLLIGEFQDSKDAILDLVRTQNLGSHVEIHDFMPYNEMLFCLRQASLGLALYQPEGHFLSAGIGGARKLFTYMQAGIPVVAPSFGGFAQLVNDVGFGLAVDTTCPQQVCEAICTLLRDEPLRTELGGRGRRAFEQKYNWHMERRKLLGSYAVLFPRQAIPV